MDMSCVTQATALPSGGRELELSVLVGMACPAANCKQGHAQFICTHQQNKHGEPAFSHRKEAWLLPSKSLSSKNKTDKKKTIVPTSKGLCYCKEKISY